MVWQPNILNNCYELSGSYAPPGPPTRGSSVPQTLCAPHFQILATPLGGRSASWFKRYSETNKRTRLTITLNANEVRITPEVQTKYIVSTKNSI